MTFSNLVHLSIERDGALRSRRSGRLTALIAALLLPLSGEAFAQALDWGKWQEAALNSDKGTPPGIAYGARGTCEGMKLVARHAYWRCMARSGNFFWEGASDAIYTCPDGKGFRRLEKSRFTNIPCGNKDWQITKHLADLYEETWQKKIDDPPEVSNPQTPPTTEAELPPNTGSDTPPSWDGSGPPWAPKEAEKKDEGKTDTAKTDAKTDTTKTDTSKTDTDKKVTGGGATKKANRKEVQKQGKSVARRRIDDDYGQGGGLSPEAATAIGTAIEFGLGGMGRGRMGGERMGGSRMMDR